MSQAKTILFIEDNDTVRRYYTDCLKLLFPDYKIFEAITGKTGLDLYWSLSVDCVILDLSLPDGSGFDVLAKLVPNRSEPRVPVVILTSVNSQSILDVAKFKGAFVALQKDLTSGEDLGKVIRDAIATLPAASPSPPDRDFRDPVLQSLPESDA